MPERKEHRAEEPLEILLDKPVYPFDVENEFSFRNLQGLEEVLSRDFIFHQVKGNVRLVPAGSTLDELYVPEGIEFPLGPTRLAFQFDAGRRLIAEVPLEIQLPGFDVTSLEQVEYLSQFYGELKIGEHDYFFLCNGGGVLREHVRGFDKGLGVLLLSDLYSDEKTSTGVLLPMDREKVRSIELTIRRYEDDDFGDEPLPTTPDVLVRV